MPVQQPPNIRPDARDLAAFLGSMGVSLTQFAPGPDGWHSEASIRACLAATAHQAGQREPRRVPVVVTRSATGQRGAPPVAAAVDRTPAAVPGSSAQGDVVAWALATNRIVSASAPAWRQRLAADPSVVDTLRALTPVDHSASAPQATPRRIPPAAGPYASTAGLPAFTASGIDPKAIAGYAPIVRSVLAAIPDRDVAFAVAQRYGAMSQDEAIKVMWQDPQIPVDVLHAATPADYVEPPKFTSTTTTVTEGPLAGNAAAIQRRDLQAHQARSRASDPEHAAFWDAVNARTAATSRTGLRTTKPDTKPSDDYWF